MDSLFGVGFLIEFILAFNVSFSGRKSKLFQKRIWHVIDTFKLFISESKKKDLRLFETKIIATLCCGNCHQDF